MKKSLIITLCIAGLVSCSYYEEISVVKPNRRGNCFFASLSSGDSKVHLELDVKINVVWDQDDRVAVCAGSSNLLEYVVPDGYAGHDTTTLVPVDEIYEAPQSSCESFSFIENTLPEENFDANVAFYPFRMVHWCHKDDNVYEFGINVPTVQDYSENSFGKDASPMVATTADTCDVDLYFQNIMGLLRLCVCGDFEIKKLVVRSNTNESLSGDAVVKCKYKDSPSLSFAGHTVDSVVLLFDKPIALSGKNCEQLFIAIPPTEFSDGISVDFYIGNGIWTRRYCSPLEVKRSAISTICDTLSKEKLYKEYNVPAISYIDDDFLGVNNQGEVTPGYQVIHDFCARNHIFCSFATITADVSAREWIPEKRVAVMNQWQDEGFEFLYHPRHDAGWYNYDEQNPHNASEIESSISQIIDDFQIYGLKAPSVLVWPGNSNSYQDNYPIVRKYFDAAVIASLTGTNHCTDNSRFELQRLSLQNLSTGVMTKSSLKKTIYDSIQSGDWVILGSHLYEAEESLTTDETSYNLGNVFEILQYADSLCPIMPVAEVWAKRHIMYDILGK